MTSALNLSFILDVLQDYTTIREAFKLVKVSEDNPELIEGAASKALFVLLLTDIEIFPRTISMQSVTISASLHEPMRISPRLSDCTTKICLLNICTLPIF